MKVTKEGAAIGEICFLMVAIMRGLMDGVEKLMFGDDVRCV